MAIRSDEPEMITGGGMIVVVPMRVVLWTMSAVIVALVSGYLYLLGRLGNAVVDLGREIDRPEPFMRRSSPRRIRKRSSLSSLPVISIYPVFPLATQQHSQ